MLMNENIQYPNNKKFYILQIIQSDTNPKECFFFTRWGRVGVPGQNVCLGPYP